MAPVAFGRRAVLVLIGVFLVTRIVGAYLADHPDAYGTPGTGVVGDVEIYRSWAERIAGQGLAPYSEVPIEYPPGVLPFALAPTIGPESAYRTGFIALMLLVDVAGLAGLWFVARRRGSLLGPWLWVIGVPAIGPILYLRLDLIPAVATIWAFERVTTGAWAEAGGWLGFGFITKIYPALLLPGVAIMAAKRRAVLWGAAVVTVIALLPFVRSLGPLFSSVVEYHASRGLQIESLWAGALLFAGHFGYGVAIEFNFGAFHLASSLSPVLKTIADVASVAALGAGMALAWRLRRSDDDRRVAEVSFATLACVLGLGTVFSPQFMVWVLALAAVVACSRESPIRRPALAIIPLCALTQFIYPFAYDHIVFRDQGELVPLTALLVRDVGIVVIGLASVWLLWRDVRSQPVVNVRQEPARRAI
jgi:hypothetical protein